MTFLPSCSAKSSVTSSRRSKHADRYYFHLFNLSDTVRCLVSRSHVLSRVTWSALDEIPVVFGRTERWPVIPLDVNGTRVILEIFQWQRNMQMFLCASRIARKIRECLLRGHLPAVMEPPSKIYAALRSRFRAGTLASKRVALAALSSAARPVLSRQPE